MGVKGYPPSHRDLDELQPEVCYICGAYMGAQRMKLSHIEGIEGLPICDLHEWRDMPTILIHQEQTPEILHGIGGVRVYPPGADTWFFGEE